MPNLDENAAGSHETLEPIEFEWTRRPEELARQSAEFEKSGIYCCAGYAALNAAGYSQRRAAYGTGSDFERAEAVTSTPLTVIKERAIELMSRPENIAAVARLAGFFDQNEGRVEPAPNPFTPQILLTMSPE